MTYLFRLSPPFARQATPATARDLRDAAVTYLKAHDWSWSGSRWVNEDGHMAVSLESALRVQTRLEEET